MGSISSAFFSKSGMEVPYASRLMVGCWVVAGWAGLAVAVAGGGVFCAFTAVRMARMAVTGRIARPDDLAKAFVVAGAYDAGRALSLILPARHRHRQEDCNSNHGTRRQTS